MTSLPRPAGAVALGEGESDGDGDARGDTDGEAGGVDPVARVGVVPGWKADRAKTPASPRATTTASSAPSERARPPRLRCRPLAPIGYRRLPDGRAGGGSVTEPPPTTRSAAEGDGLDDLALRVLLDRDVVAPLHLRGSALRAGPQPLGLPVELPGAAVLEASLAV